MGFNPSATSTLGLEWMVTNEGVTPLSTSTSTVAFLIASTATETIDKLYVPHTWSGPSTGYGKLVADIYNLSDTGAGAALTTTRFKPNYTAANTNMYAPYPWASITTTCHQYVDDGDSYNDSDYLGFANTSSCRFAFDTTAFTGQVSSVSFNIRAFGFSGSSPKLAVQLYNNTTFVSTLGNISPPATGDDVGPNFPTWSTYTVGPFTTNPLTGTAWTASDITSFDTNTNLLIQLSLISGCVGVSWVSMIVESGTDKRVATGSTATQTTLPSGVQTNLPITLSADWSKATSTNYLCVLRRLDDPSGQAATLIPQPVYLGTATCPHGQGKTYSTTLEPTGLLKDAGSVDATKTIPFWLGIKTTNAASADSQPYWDLDAKPVHNTSTVTQRFSGAAATAYKQVRFMVGLKATPTASLSIKVKKASDNSQVGGTGTLAVADLSDAQTAYYIGQRTLYDGTTMDVYEVLVQLATSATLAGATQYYIEFTSTTTNDAVAWYPLVLHATQGHALTGNLTYGGATDYAVWSASNQLLSDVMVTIATSPAAPATITVTNVTTTVNGTSIDYAKVEWTDGGALGASFLRWEVDRSEDAGTTWTTIAHIYTEATLRFDDYEGKRGNANKYRVRKIRSDYARSDYTTQSGTVTPAALTSKAYVFTTNADPAITAGYQIKGDSISMDFLSASETVFMKLHDRDYQASFRPLEERGLSWSFQALVHASRTAPTSGHGVRAFDVLRALGSVDDASLCMHTPDGERFFGVLNVEKGSRTTSGVYLAACKFTQTQGDSSVVVV